MLPGEEDDVGSGASDRGLFFLFFSAGRTPLTSTRSQGIIMYLQSLPTQGWTDHEIELLLSEAFVHYSTWHNAQSHFGK